MVLVPFSTKDIKEVAFGEELFLHGVNAAADGGQNWILQYYFMSKDICRFAYR